MSFTQYIMYYSATQFPRFRKREVICMWSIENVKRSMQYVIYIFPSVKNLFIFKQVIILI